MVGLPECAKTQARGAFGENISDDVAGCITLSWPALCHEISQRLIRRYLAENIAPPEAIGEMTFADIIRVANQNQLLLGDWPRWKGWRDMRARTRHSYDEQVALDVVAGIPGFLDEARFLRDRLPERLSQ